MVSECYFDNHEVYSVLINDGYTWMCKDCNYIDMPSGFDVIPSNDYWSFFKIFLVSDIWSVALLFIQLIAASLHILGILI